MRHAQLTVADLETLAPHPPQRSGSPPGYKEPFQPKLLRCQSAFAWGSQDIRALRRKMLLMPSERSEWYKVAARQMQNSKKNKGRVKPLLRVCEIKMITSIWKKTD